MFNGIVSPSVPFGNLEISLDKADFAIFGVPLDQRSSGRKATINGPDLIRRASLEIEEYSLRFDLDYNTLKVCDLGNIQVLKFENALELVKKIMLRIFSSEKIPVMIGGEHTFTYSAISALHPTHIVVFDAHLDLRDEYLGEKLCHATHFRRILEEFDNLEIMYIGFRGFCQEELDFIREKNNIKVISSYSISENRDNCIKEIREFLSNSKRVYISIDLDVLDPAYMWEVSNPEPEGLTPKELMDMFILFKDCAVVAADIMEYSPLFLWTPCSYLAAKVVFELLASLT